MISPSSLYPKSIDLTNCDKEPIHILGHIQSHGVLLSCSQQDLTINYCSANSEQYFDNKPEYWLGKPLSHLLGEDDIRQIQKNSSPKGASYANVKIGNNTYSLIHHLTNDQYILEFEPKIKSTNIYDYQQQLTDIVSEMSKADTVQGLCDTAAFLIKYYLQYDRVMIYRFDKEWNGQIVAEAKEENLESWLDLRYPASDIPQQARKLFLRQGTRIISDVHGEYIPILSLNGHEEPLDLSLSELRAVSPIHIEYLQNMKVGATLNVAIVYHNVLWGLVSCHHYSPKYIDYHQRMAGKFLTQTFSIQLGLQASNTILESANRSNQIRNKIIEQISKHWDLLDGLTNSDASLLELVGAEGAAIFISGTLTTLGKTPDSEDIERINTYIWDNANNEGVFCTEHIQSYLPDVQKLGEIAAGVLAIVISPNKKNSILWFRPEKLQTVHWGGNPNKSVVQEDARLSPRKSFEKWTEEQQGVSLPWQDQQISAAKALKENLSEIIFQKYDEIRKLNDNLHRAYRELESFSYSISHDLRAPLRGIDGFAQIIKEDYFNSLDDFGQSAVDRIIDSAHRMNNLIDDILAYSVLGQRDAEMETINTYQLVTESLALLQVESQYPNTEIDLDIKLPNSTGDKAMLFQVFNNLISNAFKYSHKVKNSKVTIGYSESLGAFFIKDNGIGFDTKHAEKIFGIFNRLVNDEYEGTGIGLAIVSRIIQKHNGKIWAESTEGSGSTFYFKLHI